MIVKLIERDADSGKLVHREWFDCYRACMAETVFDENFKKPENVNRPMTVFIEDSCALVTKRDILNPGNEVILMNNEGKTIDRIIVD